MKKLILSLFIIIPVGLLSYSYALVSFLLLIVIVLSLAVLMGSGLIKLFRKSMSTKWLKAPAMVAGICFLGIGIGFLRPLNPATVTSENVSETLAYAYETDQADRKTLKSYIGMYRDEMIMRDSIRLDQVLKLYKEQKITKPLDKFHAAFVFHHGKKSSLYEVAHKLASEAAAVSELKDVYLVQWLTKASYDRWMISLGKPQKYGTQEAFSVGVQ